VRFPQTRLAVITSREKVAAGPNVPLAAELRQYSPIMRPTTYFN
jgi:hypothetical protein